MADAVDVSGLVKFQGQQFSNGWVKIQIPVSNLSPEQMDHLRQAEDHLRQANIGFDTGTGGGHRDWEFDFSLSGAVVKISTPYCMKCHLPIHGIVPCAVWANATVYPFCSEDCRETTIKKRAEGGIEVLARLNLSYAQVKQ